MIKDIKILSVIIIISVALFGYTFTFDEVPEILAQGMQPTMMPRLIFSLIIFLSVFQLVQNKKLKSETKELIRRNAFITFGYTLFIVLIADKLGFFISIFLYTCNSVLSLYTSTCSCVVSPKPGKSGISVPNFSMSPMLNIL